jgi:mono/diheme cytochrome c family protein
MVNRNLAIALLALSVLLAACSGGPPNGQQVFTLYCSSCHATNGDGVFVGPSLAGVATRAETRVAGMGADAYIRQSILEPSAFIVPGFDDLMPKTWDQVLTDKELNALVEFLLTLK